MLPLLLLTLVGATEALDLGEAALSAFRAEEAVAHLELARDQGPYAYPDNLRLYEQLGVAHAYLDHRDEARAAFAMLLDLAPGHAIDYTLSPKVTFMFQEVRSARGVGVAPQVQLNWSRDLTTTDQVPIDIEVVSDPRGFMKRATLHTRLRGADSYDQLELELAEVGTYRSLTLPAPAAAARQPEVLQLYLVVRDEQGNEVHLVGSSEHPREISLSYEAPTPWFARWWLWAAAGGAAAIAVGVGVFALTYQAPDEIGGSFGLIPAP